MRPPQIRDVGGILVIKLDDASALNEGNPLGLRQALFKSLPETPGARVVADLKAIDFLSSSGIALLIGLKRRVEERGGRLVLIETKSSVIDQFRVTKLADFFTFAAKMDDAVGLLPSPPAV